MKQAQRAWRTLDGMADVAASSEDPSFPVAAAVTLPHTGEWRAAAPGEQAITVRFTEPTEINRVRVVIRDNEQSRTQELTIGWCARGDTDFQVVIRQQFNFDPRGATVEQEEYLVNLSAVSVLELRIVPDISGGDAIARVSELRIA